ncbi:DUF2147 domain-containing protein [Pedobacter insulae]|uniref:Uncharacterized conserved protein, DUF2147 family n=1 Tax=Pedobacter insulae TaxID=414048 RepID=A0A1I3A7R4_9SPHI|nr:DUF2147 domain-containing protein [Pedobacter insulae]SFH45965.1 Uncharacterized conserved protein, DUF2147 family [Pedobacter insulae]
MIKKLSFILFLLALTATAFAQNKDAVLGKWLNATGEGQIEIYKRADKYFGKLVWVKEPNDQAGKPKTDHKNPNANLKSKPILGLEILKDFVFEDGRWTDGTVYDPKTGKTYSCNLSLKENGQLNIRGYIGVSLIGRSESWKRVK